MIGYHGVISLFVYLLLFGEHVHNSSVRTVDAHSGNDMAWDVSENKCVYSYIILADARKCPHVSRVNGVLIVRLWIRPRMQKLTSSIMFRIPTECPQHFVSLRIPKKKNTPGKFRVRALFKKILLSGFGFDG